MMLYAAITALDPSEGEGKVYLRRKVGQGDRTYLNDDGTKKILASNHTQIRGNRSPWTQSSPSLLDTMTDEGNII